MIAYIIIYWSALTEDHNRISRVITISILLTVTVLHTYNCYLVETKMFFKLSLAILLSFGGGARGGGGGAIFLQQGQFGQSKVIIYISSWYIYMLFLSPGLLPQWNIWPIFYYYLCLITNWSRKGEFLCRLGFDHEESSSSKQRRSGGLHQEIQWSKQVYIS